MTRWLPVLVPLAVGCGLISAASLGWQAYPVVMGWVLIIIGVLEGIRRALLWVIESDHV